MFLSQKAKSYFQNTCINIKDNDSKSEVNVFKVIPSLKNIPTKTA